MVGIFLRGALGSPPPRTTPRVRQSRGTGFRKGPQRVVARGRRSSVAVDAHPLAPLLEAGRVDPQREAEPPPAGITVSADSRVRSDGADERGRQSVGHLRWPSGVLLAVLLRTVNLCVHLQ